MLVLGRRFQDDVFLIYPGGVVVMVTLCTADQGRARLGFTAPDGVEIVRAETLSADQQAKLRAAAGVVDETMGGS